VSRCTLKLLPASLLVSVVCFAQLDTATIVGTVLDQSGAVIPNAPVSVENQNMGATFNATSNGEGNFIVPVLPIGTYRVTVSAAGFKAHTVEGLTLRVSDRMRVDITLETGSIREKITVASESPLVDSASSTLGGFVNTQQLGALPLNGRDVVQLLAIIPGSSLLGGATQQSVNGASTFRSEGGVRFLLDGSDASRVDFDILEDTYGSSKGRITRASVDSLQEIRVYTSSFSAEYGQALGGVINLITKSGTNDFHGSIFEYFRNEKLDTRNYFNAGAKPPFRLNQFGGSAGGPIRKNRLFFPANYEGLRQRLGIIQNAFVPTAAFRATAPSALQPVLDMLPLPSGPASAGDPRLAQFLRGISNPLTEDTGSIKIDYRISDNDTFTAHYNINESLTQNYFGVARGQIQTAPATMQLAKLTHTHIFSPHVLNEAGFGFNRAHIDPRSADSEEIQNFPIVSLGSGSAGVGPGLFDLQVANNSFTYLDTLSWVAGNHQLKFGTQIIRNQDNKALLFQRTVTYNTLDDFAANSPFSIGTLGQPRRGMRNTYENFFVQDDIQVARALTVNAGLRYQYDTAPSEASGVLANFDPVKGALDPPGTQLLNAPKTNFAPRIGVAWSPFGARRTVIRSGFGIFHGTLNAALAQNVPNNVFQQGITITRQQQPNLVGFPFPTITSFAALTNYTALPKNWTTGYTEQWNLNVQQPVGQNAMLQIGYIGNRGVHLDGTYNLNRLFPGTALRPFSRFGNISMTRNDLVSDYNSLQVSYRKRFSRGLTFNVNYTWSHVLDEGGVAFGTAAQDDSNPHDAYANADFDARHVLEFDYTYQLPAVPNLPAVLFKGWQINGLTQMRSGLSVNVVCGCDSMQIGSTSSRANVVPGVPQKLSPGDIPGAQINRAAFTAPPTGTWGNVGRNALKGPAAYNWDFSIFKDFKLTERQTLQFRAESFNLFNTPQFQNPGANLSAAANFGRSTSTISTPDGFGTNRQNQLALRYTF
jgi:hypothetical protein